jgi:hypothetical protein
MLNPSGQTIKTLEGRLASFRRGSPGDFGVFGGTHEIIPKSWAGSDQSPDGGRRQLSPILYASADTGATTDALPAGAQTKGDEIAYMNNDMLLGRRSNILEGGRGGFGAGGALGGAMIGGTLLGAATKGTPPGLPAEPVPPVPGLTPPLVKVEGYGTPISDPTRPNILVFPAQSPDVRDSIMEQRRERPETKAQIDAVRDHILKAHPEWSHVGGGRVQGDDQEVPEYHVPGPGTNLPERGEGDSRPRGGYTDLTFKTEDGNFVHVQTVDVDPKTGKPSTRELDNAERIRRMLQREQGGRHDVYLIPKSHQLPPRR